MSALARSGTCHPVSQAVKEHGKDSDPIMLTWKKDEGKMEFTILSRLSVCGMVRYDSNANGMSTCECLGEMGLFVATWQLTS